MKIRNVGREDKIQLQMTPMIDIVFQLLVFFVMTFKIAQPEGDFNIKMPQASPKAGTPSDELPPMTIRLRAAEDGSLASIRLNERNVESFGQLRIHIISLVGNEQGPGGDSVSAEIEIDSDYHLKYEHTMAAVTAISGYVNPTTGNVIKLIDKIRFAPPRR